MTKEEQAKYDAYIDVYSYLHYDYKSLRKSKDQVIGDVKKFCLKKSIELTKNK